MDSYFKEKLDSGQVYTITDIRTILTDRMGTWDKQSVALVLIGYDISITPEEAKILFEDNRLLRVSMNSEGSLLPDLVDWGSSYFNGSIVCGTLYPTLTLREGILDYAKKMGYITDEPTAVEMHHGTKLLVKKKNGKYGIKFTWSEELEETCNKDDILSFSSKFWLSEMYRKSNYDDELFYSSPKYLSLKHGFMLDGLSEVEVFSPENISSFREYDFVLGLLNPKVDLDLLLEAIVQYAFINRPYMMEKLFRLSIASSYLRKHYKNNFSYHPYVSKLSNDVRSVALQNGSISCNDWYGKSLIKYQLTAPYSEDIRTLMVNFERITERTLRTSRIEFNKREECIDIISNPKVDSNASIPDIEKAFVTLDYAISILRATNNNEESQMIGAIMEFMDSLSDFEFREKFCTYSDLIHNILY